MEAYFAMSCINALVVWMILQWRDARERRRRKLQIEAAAEFALECSLKEAAFHAAATRSMLTELEKADTDPEVGPASRAVIFTFRQLLKHLLIVQEQRVDEYKRALPKAPSSPSPIGKSAPL